MMSVRSASIRVTGGLTPALSGNKLHKASGNAVSTVRRHLRLVPHLDLEVLRLTGGGAAALRAPYFLFWCFTGLLICGARERAKIKPVNIYAKHCKKSGAGKHRTMRKLAITDIPIVLRGLVTVSLSNTILTRLYCTH